MCAAQPVRLQSASGQNQAKAGRAGWIRTRRYTARINNNPRTQAVPAAKMGMLKEIPPADTEAHSVHTETSSFPTAELEAQLGQQVFIGLVPLMARFNQYFSPQKPVPQPRRSTETAKAAPSGHGSILHCWSRPLGFNIKGWLGLEMLLYSNKAAAPRWRRSLSCPDKLNPAFNRAVTGRIGLTTI